MLDVRNYGDYYHWQPGPPWGSHPLLEATLTLMGLPPNLACEISISSSAPSGASTGTSAAVTVALIGALAHLLKKPLNHMQVAMAAHRVETELLGQQCGIQDQLAAAFGGINLIDMDLYPHATVNPVLYNEQTSQDLQQRLALVYLGKPHQSSSIHQMVIQGLEKSGATNLALEALRLTALKAADGLSCGDFHALGSAMIENTNAQARLHPALVSQDARLVIAIAQEYSALGWKVNGAGGDGGSITLLGSEDENAREKMLEAILQTSSLYKIIPICLSPQGLIIWEDKL